MVHIKILLQPLYLISLGLGISIGTHLAHAQGLPEYFDTEVTIQPCPEFWLQNMVIDVFYRIGNNPELIAADIQSQTLDSETKTYTPVIRFPSFYGTTPFSVFAFCRSALGFSDASNPAQVSNCDSLARFDSDGDGIPNHLEDTNCDNFYSPGDASNPFNVDTDGNGVRDLVEILSGTDPNNPASSPRPSIFSGGSFDIDADGISNPLVWRPSNGTWYIQNNSTKGLHTAFQFGMSGDIPFTYRNNNQESDVGVIRNIQNQYHWFFRGKGITINATDTPSIVFGIFGDNIILGPWEKPGVTSPAVARLFNGIWTFDILLSDGTVRSQVWGGNGDIPKPQDFDGDGIFDLAVYRPGDQKTYIIPSTNTNTALIYDFGSGTAEHTVRGDYTGDGKEDISFWEPLSGTFTSLLSDKGFDTEKAKLKDPDHYREFDLGEYFLDLPLSWNTDGNKHLYTIINHQTGVRKFYPDNDKSKGLIILQWGLSGDSQG
jgi:hypothetical protein